jgi:hypothetical protein
MNDDDDDDDEREPSGGSHLSSCGVVEDDSELRDLLIDLKELAAKGLRDGEIAARLEISVSDVELLRERLLDGLGDA